MKFNRELFLKTFSCLFSHRPPRTIFSLNCFQRRASISIRVSVLYFAMFFANLSLVYAQQDGSQSSSYEFPQVNLQWNDNSNNEDGFMIERAEGKSLVFEELATVDANVTNFQDQGLQFEHEYTYRVRATLGSELSDYSNIASIITPAEVIPNDPPVASELYISTEEGVDVLIQLNGTDTNDDALIFSIIQPPAHGTLIGLNVITGECIYSPAGEYSGLDKFQYVVNDGTVNSQVATVTIGITEKIDLPVCGNGVVEDNEECDDGNTASGDGCSSQCQTEATDQDLVAYYPFDGNAEDFSGNEHHGFPSGPRLISGVSGKGYQFDGEDDYIAIQNLKFEQAGEINTLTISAWVQTDFIGVGRFDNWAVLDFDRSEYFSFYIRGDNGRLGFSTKDESGGLDDFNGNTPINDGKWHFITAVYDGTDKIVYVDGVEDGRRVNAHGGKALGTGATRYGFIGDGSEANAFDGKRNLLYYDGLLDEVKFYSRGLSSQEIVQEFESIEWPEPPPHPVPTKGLVASYSFEGNGNDQSENGYNGQVIGVSFDGGKMGMAANFDGTDDYIAIEDLNFSQTGELSALSICSWVKTDVSGEREFSNWAILDFDRSENFSFYVRGDNGKLGFATASSNGEIHDFYSTTPVNDGLWHFVCAVYDGKDKELYIDGLPKQPFGKPPWRDGSWQGS